MIDSPLVLVLVLGAMIAVPMLLKRQRAEAPDGLRVVGRTALGRNAVVAVVAVGERRLLVGSGEQGVQLLAELDRCADDGDAAGSPIWDPGTTMTTLGRTDAVDATTSTSSELDLTALSVSGLELAQVPTAGPGIGLVDRLRAMTVRTPVQGRPLHVPFRR